jgi:hypothetical protein
MPIGRRKQTCERTHGVGNASHQKALLANRPRLQLHELPV